MIPGSIHPLLAGKSEYKISNSLRFRASASARLTRTYGATGSSQKFTGSIWIKRGILGSAQSIFGAQNTGAATWDVFAFNASDQLQLFIDPGTTPYNVITTAVFRDPSAWYHVVFSVDTTQATAANRVRIYVNNVEQSLGTNTIPQNYNLRFNVSGNTAGIGTEVNYAATTGPAKVIDGYFAEINWVDGQQLTPSSFGQTDSATGVWVPKAYSGTYGTNGFYLKFSDASAATAAAIGKDSSGNGNNWTPSGISVTSGTTYDQMTDTPTLNYAVFDALSPVGSASSIGTLSAANMTLDHSTNNYAQRFGSFAVNSGKWYFEYTITTFSSQKSCAFGIGKTESYPSGTGVPGSWTGCVAYGDYGDTYLRPITEAAGISNTSGVASMTFAVNDVIMIAFDVGAGKFWMGKNGTWFDSGNPAGGTNEKQTFTANINWRPWCVQFGSSAAQSVVNFGQRPFAYTPPAGFKALNSQNLPTPPIKKGSLYMDATLRTGTGATASVSSLSFAPDLVWIKSRSAATNNNLFDRSRGATVGLVSQTVTAEYTDTNSLTAFSSNGYTLGSDASSRGVNINTNTYVDWAWKQGATPGFDVVLYTGNGTNRTVSHSLGVAPAFYVCKYRSGSNADEWFIYHKSLGATKYIRWSQSLGSYTGSTYWNDTEPTSSVFSLGTNSAINTNSSLYVSYLWSEVEGFSKFNSYTGNGSTNGPFVWCGFRPRYVLIKSTGTENWSIQDSVRNPYNVVDARLKTNSADVEAVSSFQYVDFLSNGFKIRNTDTEKNGSGTTYIFAAFAETPFKYARAR